MILDMSLSLISALYIIAFRTLYDLPDAYVEHIKELRESEEYKASKLLERWLEDFNCIVKDLYPLNMIDERTISRSMMTSRPDTFLFDYSALKFLRFDENKNLNTNYGIFNQFNHFK
jgi:hypothetical protein